MFLFFTFLVKMPYELESIQFHEDYSVPAPPSLFSKDGKKRAPEEIEEELKAQQKDLERLALLTIE